MEKIKSATDIYYKHIEDNYCNNICEVFLGEEYDVNDGAFRRIKIEDGIEISQMDIRKEFQMDFCNKDFKYDILEIGYCYKGKSKVSTIPGDDEYLIEEGDVCIYQSLNKVDSFNIRYNECKFISINVNFDVMSNSINPLWGEKLISEWKHNIKNIFKNGILIVEKADCEIKKIANEIDNISADNMMGYINIKLKTIEFLAKVLEKKYGNRKLKYMKKWENEVVNNAENIIKENLTDCPSVKDIADILGVSLYKLQQGFKNITGNTVYEYIKRAKIEKAKQLLIDTDMSIIDIANELGYDNPSKFSSVFKSYNNITPLKYRNSLNKVN